MIKQIEEFGTEFERLRFVGLEFLLQDKIEIHQIGSAKISDARVAENMGELLAGSKRGHSKGALIEPAVQRLMAGVGAAVGSLSRGVKREVIRIGNLIGSVAGASRAAQVR